MSDKTLREALTDIADAIRAKGVTGTMSALEMPTKIASIPYGSGSKYGISIDGIIGDVNGNGELQAPGTSIDFTSTSILSVPDSILKETFKDNAQVVGVELPNLITIGSSGMEACFSGCSNLTTVDFSSLQRVYDLGLYDAFNGCSSLTSADLGSLQQIDSGALEKAFQGCSNLTSINLSNLSQCGYNALNETFKDSGVTSLVLSSLTNSSNGFYGMCDGCSSLVSVDLRNVSTLEQLSCSFRQCTSLTTVKLNKLSSVYYWDECFKGCSSMMLIDFSEAVAVPSLNTTSAFDGMNDTYVIKVPDSLYAQWKSADNWSDDDIAPHINPATGCVIFKANEANSTVQMIKVISTGGENPPSISLQYSTDQGTTWNSFVVGGSTVGSGTVITLTNVGDEVWFRAGPNGNGGFGKHTNYAVRSWNQFYMTGKIEAYGNMMYLISQDGNTPMSYYQFPHLFDGCSALITAPDLPSTSLTNHCYVGMFRGCTSLKKAPRLPATAMQPSCYMQMFQSCSALTEPPVLPATRLSDSCYRYMFSSCSSLTEAPDLISTQLSPYCYENMFLNCSSLVEISLKYPGRFSDTPTTAFSDWVKGVAASGTLYYNGSDTTVGDSAIPTGWTVVEDLPLTLTARQAGSRISWRRDYNAPSVNLEYKVNAGSWTPYDYQNNSTITLTNVGDKVMFRATSAGNHSFANSPFNTNGFSMEGQIAASGNVMYLINKDGIADMYPYQFDHLFSGCQALVDVSNLRFPARKLVANCYESIFEYCMSITTPPKLPATSLAVDCYGGMFRECSSMTTAPELPAEKLAKYCYEQMFVGCSGLLKAPYLRATTLKQGCYENMFNGDYSLNEIKLAYTGEFGDEFNGWVDGVSSPGTFYYNGSDTSSDKIPSGWTVQTFTP